MAVSASARLRLLALVFGVLLAVEAAWLLPAEAIRPNLPYFPADQTEIETVTKRHDAASTAAHLGWPRGELWVDAAIAADAGVIERGAAMHTVGDGASAHAAALAPSDARPWLLLAATGSADGAKERTLAPLKMSFYTAPNEVRLIPLRLRIAVRADSTSDEELQNLIEHDMRTILMRAPMLKPAMVAAYAGATAAGRRFMEDKLAALDPGFLGELRKTRR